MAFDDSAERSIGASGGILACANALMHLHREHAGVVADAALALHSLSFAPGHIGAWRKTDRASPLPAARCPLCVGLCCTAFNISVRLNPATNGLDIFMGIGQVGCNLTKPIVSITPKCIGVPIGIAEMGLRTGEAPAVQPTRCPNVTRAEADALAAWAAPSRSPRRAAGSFGGSCAGSGC